ncbi:MAG TPA: serine hydrolase domain-containing protein [Gemmatimonadales bacterium]|nr:serine hydrolase domain-containing protein [Gemmatimonadales bacterium]
MMSSARAIIAGITTAFLAAGIPLAVIAQVPARSPERGDAAVSPAPREAVARTDALLARWNSDSTPGCVVGAARNGEQVFAKAYGMADLERNVPLSVTSVLEAGSVSKQFAAAATVLLAEEGKLSLDDDIRRYLPEVPDYGETITIRHLLNHTSGLRDWGSVASIAGQGRGLRAYTNDHALEIVSRQRALNYPPGREYSYTNSGYNLLAIIIERVSGERFAAFTERRIFRPLGMKDTQWRDDPRRIVPRRAMAYGGNVERGWTVDQPHEFVHGNGGLLTTVADLMRWDQARSTGGLGGSKFRETMEERGVLNDGTQITYAAGLQVDTLAGLRSVAHTGSTGGYRAYLARYPERGVTVVMLCNAGDVSPGNAGGEVARAFLGLPAGRPALVRASSVERQNLPPARVEELVGEYYSPDAATRLTLRLENGQLIARRPPVDDFPLTAAGDEEFTSRLGRIRFIRAADGSVVQLSVQASRVYDLRFDRVK